MKKFRLAIVLTLLVFSVIAVSSCRVFYPTHPAKKTNTVIIQSNPSGKVPPGQMKKATGAKSAKKYAPGQNKMK
jgi:hypothetical protein